MNYEHGYLRSFGIHPCTVVFADKKTDKYGTKYVVTFEHLVTHARIDTKLEIGIDGKIAEGKTGKYSRETMNSILKAVDAKTPAELIGKEILVLVEPYEWEKNGRSGTMWTPKKFWNYRYAQYLGETQPLHEVADQPVDEIPW